MIDNNKKESNTVPAPKKDLVFDGAEALDDDEMDGVAGGFGLNTINLTVKDQIQNNLGGKSGGAQGDDKELTRGKKKGLVKYL